MKIKSPVFINGEEIPFKYSCDGINISPPLIFKEVPQSARSLALVVDDPDAPNGVFVHWVVWNINPKIAEIKEGIIPEGAIQGDNSAGDPTYTGPCPLSGVHRYFFKLYALNKVLNLEKGSDWEVFKKALRDSIIEKAELMGVYSR